MRWVPPAHSPLAWSDIFRVIGADGCSQERARDTIRLRFDAQAVLPCDSGTSALVMALKVAGTTHAGPIAVPAYGCFDIATAVDGCADAVLLYDLDPATLGPDHASLDRALRAGARRVVAAPLYGVPLAWDALYGQCAAAGAVLIEDAAQGSGAEWLGRAHGSLGELALLSFGRGKGRSAGGGGALLARSQRMAEALRQMETPQVRGPGRAATALRIAAQLALGAPARFGLVASVQAFGIGDTPLRAPTEVAAMPNAQAALVPFALQREADEIAQRRQHAARWLSELPTTLFAPEIPDGARAGYLRFPVLRSPDTALTRAERQLGIGGAYPQILADLEPIAARRVVKHKEPLTGARELVARLVTLPTHSLLQARDLDALTRWLKTQR